MRTLSTILLIALLSLIFAATLSAQWVQTNGLYGGVIRSLAVSGTDIFAGNGGGIFLSTNNGDGWTQVYPDRGGDDVTSIIVNGTNLIAGTWYGTILLSTDTGRNWTDVNTGIPYGKMTPLTTIGTNVFVGIDNNVYGGVYRSTDNGLNWTAVNNGLPIYWTDSTMVITSLVAKGTNLFAGGYDGWVYLSTNNGDSWTLMSNGLPSNMIVMTLAAIGTNIYASDDFHGIVFLSTNNGVNWSAANTPFSSFNCMIQMETNIFAGTSGQGAFISTDNGINWNAINSGLMDLRVFSLSVSGSNIFAGTGGSGIFISTNTGSSWTKASSDLTIFGIRCFVINGMNLFAGTGIGVFRYSNNGSNWTQVNVNSDPYGLNVSALSVSENNIFAVTDIGVFRSTDNGVDWTSVATGVTVPLAIVSSNSNVFVGGEKGLYPSAVVSLSTDGGTSWKDISNGLGGCGANVFAYSNRGLLVGTGQCPTGFHPAGVYQLRDNDTTWTNIGLDHYYGINCLAVSDTIIFTTMGSVIRSTDNGITWSAANTPFSGFSCMTQIGTNLFFGTGSGVYHSTNNGTSWTDVNTKLTDSNIVALTISDSFLFAGTASGVWRRPLSEMITVVQPTSVVLPKKISLNQNYPNPFNPSTTINYQLPTQGHVTLKVFDVLGREVATLLNGVEEPGYKTVTWKAVNIPSGIYFYRLTTGSFMETKKLLLLR